MTATDPKRTVTILDTNRRHFIIVVLLSLVCASAQAQPHVPISDLVDRGWSISGPITLEQVRENHPKLITGACWNQFIANKKPDDEIRTLVSPSESWRKMMGWYGYVLVRSGRIVGSCWLMVS